MLVPFGLLLDFPPAGELPHRISHRQARALLEALLWISSQNQTCCSCQTRSGCGNDVIATLDVVVDARLAVTQVEVSRGFLVWKCKARHPPMDYQIHALSSCYSRMAYSDNSACSKMYIYGYSAGAIYSRGYACGAQSLVHQPACIYLSL